MNYEEINKNMQIKNLSKYACPYDKGIRLVKEEEDYRPTFYRDIDRIIYSIAYTRYINKTQVFSNKKNDHLSKRMTHVQFVSKIARTIGRALNLNEDLIEAASLGHDLGHTPFGHVGESILNEISLKHNTGFFNHNIQSVRLLMEVENYGKGYNLTIPVLDAIMCHNGERLEQIYEPREKSTQDFLDEYHNSYFDKNINNNLKPMTLEGCVLRISDLIAYLGKDIEDAIRLKIINVSDIPMDIKNVLGDTNSKIVNTISKDIIQNSLNHNYIKLSKEIYDAMNKLLKFNYEYIYNNALSKEEKEELKKIFNCLFNKYLEDLENDNQDSIIYTSYLSKMNEEYKKNSNERIVIDYIAGMTDEYMLRQYKELNAHK